jgi:hypothetical protein
VQGLSSVPGGLVICWRCLNDVGNERLALDGNSLHAWQRLLCPCSVMFSLELDRSVHSPVTRRTFTATDHTSAARNCRFLSTTTKQRLSLDARFLIAVNLQSSSTIVGRTPNPKTRNSASPLNFSGCDMQMGRIPYVTSQRAFFRKEEDEQDLPKCQSWKSGTWKSGTLTTSKA